MIISEMSFPRSICIIVFLSYKRVARPSIWTQDDPMNAGVLLSEEICALIGARLKYLVFAIEDAKESL